MAHSTHRRGQIEKFFSPLWNLHRVEAVDGKNATLCQSLMGADNYRLIATLFPDYDEPERPLQLPQRARLHPSELGAILSHLTTIRKAYIEGHEKVMIIEDDLSSYLMYVPAM